MTVQTNTTVATGIGNGVTSVFPIPFKFNRAEDLYAILIDSETQEFQELTLDSDYSVSGAGREEGGAVTTASPVPPGRIIKVFRIIDLLQMTDLRNQGKFFAEIHEDLFDRIVMMVQQLQEQLDRAVKVPPNSDTPADELYAEFKQDIADAEAAARASELARDESRDIADKFGDVDGAVTAAEQARDAASAHAWSAGLNAGRSEVAADRSESARDAAFVNADVYPDVASGLAAVADGGQFQVLSDDGLSYIRYRKESTTDAVEVGNGYPTPASIKDAESRTKAYMDEKAIQVSDEYLFRLIDKNENLVAEIDLNSGLRLTGINDSVQAILVALSSSIAKDPSAEHIEVLLDSRGMVVRKQTADGSLFLPGLTNSVQQEIADLKDRPSGGSEVKITDKSRELYNPVLISQVMANAASGVEFAPPPLELSPSQYSIGKDWLSKCVFSTTPDQSYVALDTPYNEDDGVVHPHIIEIPDTFRGYRYLMVITPYPGMNDQFENPVVYGSNDLLSFDMLDGMPQPLAGPPTSQYGGYNYDPYFAYDAISGELLCIWATVELQSSGGPSAGLKCLYARRTKDGFSWSEAEQITEKTTESERSSCILFNSNDGYYYMYYTPNANEFSFKRSRTLSIDGWSDKVTIDTSALGRAFWHLECKCVGDRVVVLLNDYHSSGNLYWGVSEPDDWSRFSFDATPVIADRSSIASKYSSSGVGGAYKASFLPNLDDGKLSFTILWTPAGAIGLGRKLFINQTSWYGV